MCENGSVQEWKSCVCFKFSRTYQLCSMCGVEWTNLLKATFRKNKKYWRILGATMAFTPFLPSRGLVLMFSSLMFAFWNLSRLKNKRTQLHFKSIFTYLCLGCLLFVDERIVMSTVTSELLEVLHVFIPVIHIYCTMLWIGKQMDFVIDMLRCLWIQLYLAVLALQMMF